jgi:hypothetical protein
MVAAPSADIVERPGWDKEDTVHPSLAVNALELLAVYELFSQENCVTNVQPREQFDGVMTPLFG